MIPKSFSASSAIKAQACLAMWKATYLHRGAEMSGSAASLGTAAHGGLEDFVSAGLAHDPHTDFSELEKRFAVHYNKLFGDMSRYDEGVEMLRNWWDREMPLKHRVLSTEVKENFPLVVKLTDGTDLEIPFNYIWDRCDALTDAMCAECGNCPLEIEVVDYKSVMRPVSPEDLKNKIQARAYGVAAQIKYPHAQRIWVTFDLLRYDTVGVCFTREQNARTYKYLKQLLGRIVSTPEDEAPETINEECGWCVRKVECKALASNVKVGGIHSITPQDAAVRRHQIAAQIKALNNLKGELDQVILTYADKENTFEFDLDEIVVNITAYGKRVIDAERAAKVIGPDLMSRYGSITIGAIDKMIKNGEVDDGQAAELKSLFRKQWGDPYVKTTNKNPID